MSARSLRLAATATLAVVALLVVLAAERPSRGGPADLQQQFVSVVRRVSPQVVQIKSGVGLGSGVVFDGGGNVVTNAHVTRGAQRFTVTLAGGADHSAALVGADPHHDLAVIRLAGARLSPATFDDSGVRVGDLVLAVGNPLGLRSSVTEGIISSLGRTVQEAEGTTLSSAIQTSAAINPGNSGGALVDLSGRVVGIPTLAALDPEMSDSQAPGIGFAIPSSTVQRVAQQLIAAS